jgi:transcriptional regulator with XRE-family HTH domain
MELLMASRPAVPIGKKLKELREAAGLTQQELAVKAGLSVSNVASIEQRQEGNPRINTVMALASALGVDVAELLGSEAGRGKRRRRNGNVPE